MGIIKRIVLTLAAAAICFSANGQYRSNLKKANKQYELHAFNLAITSYLEVVRKRPDNGQALGRLADCYRHLNQMEDAAKWYAQTVRQRNAEPIDIFNFAKVLMALERYEEAKQWFQLYARDNPVDGNHFVQSCNFAMSQRGVSSSYFVNNEFINTPASEFGPAFYVDRVVFSSSRTDIQRSSANWTGKANNQLFMATPGKNNFLESPVFLKSSIKNQFNEGPVSFSPDGRMVVYTKNNFVDGTRHISSSGMELSIYIAQINSNGDWVDARPFPYNGTNFSTGFPSFSQDGNSLFFASDRPDGFGGYDLYISYKMGNTWSTPENLGPVVNSPGNEVTPYSTGSALYFSSDWHHGMGGYDVFRAEQSGGRWIRIFHLGNKVNSSRDDYGFIYEGFKNLGFFTSNRPGSRGNEDIYRLSKLSDNIVLKVKNASDGTPIPNAIIDFSSCGEGVFQTDNTGIYSFQAVQGLNCDLVIKKEGYANSTLTISTLGMRQTREIDVTLNRVGEEYIGRIVSYSTRQPVAGVMVTATNQLSGSSATATTDSNGEYYLALSSNALYVLRYSGPGYRDINRTVRTTDGFDRSILGIISLLPATSFGGDLTGIEPVAPLSSGETGDPIGSGYAIQVAAISKPNLDLFNDLTNMGQLYYKSEHSKYKIRVGVFQTRAEAEGILRQVKSRGYKGAFIVEEEGEAGTQTRGGDELTGASPGFGKYKVQLAAYKNTKWFDPSGISDLGPIEERRKGNLKVKYLSGFNSLSEAKNALRRAKSAGFNTAFIVVDENGSLRKID